MSYEYDIIIVKKSDIYNITNMGIQEFKDFLHSGNKEIVDDDDDDCNFLSMLESLNIERRYSFGQYYEYANQIYESGHPFFNEKEMQDKFYEYDPFIIGKEEIAAAIEFYRKKVAEYYRTMFIPEEEYNKSLQDNSREQTQAEKISHNIKFKYIEWSKFYPYSLTGKSPVTSDTIEYEVFALVDMYRNTDWENKCGIFFGH